MKGYMDKTGKVVISPKYSYVYPFSEGLAAVAVDKRGDQWGFIDKSGTLVIPATFNWASSFKDGLAPANRTSPCGFVDRSGAFVLKPPVADGEKDCASCGATSTTVSHAGSLGASTGSSTDQARQ